MTTGTDPRPETDRPLLGVRGDTFVLGDRPHQIISGGIHYFRVHPDLWEDRLRRLAAMGCNTVETYVAWNLHERVRGTFDFTGQADLARFVTTAGDLGLDVIVRPGPYICAEWDFGGLPAWLMADGGMPLRCTHPGYLAAVDAWFAALLPVLRPLLRTQGGPVVAVQVENEYGSFGDDADYLEHCRRLLVDGGIDVQLLTSDGAGADWLANVTLPGIPATANFGSRVEESFAHLRAHHERTGEPGPLMCMEYWNGWFDHWGEQHHVRDPQDAARVLEEMLSHGASVNFYMAHGGTNHGLWNGCNVGPAGELQPTVTSYDYDAPVGEAGELRPKWAAFREVISRYAATPLPEAPPLPARLAPQTVPVTGWRRLLEAWEAFGASVEGPVPAAMEDLGADHGLMVYRGDVLVPPDGRPLLLDGLADRAVVLADDVVVGVLDRNDGLGDQPAGDPVVLQPREDGARTSLTLVVENQGRINFGPHIGERKGVRSVRLAHRHVHGWESIHVPLDRPGFAEAIDFAAGAGAAGAEADAAGGATSPDASGGPVFARAEVQVETPADGFLALPGWAKGFVWLNGVLLGRYWEFGPQVTLYAAAPLWRAGRNEVVVLELERPGSTIEVRDEPDLGPVLEGEPPV